MITRADWDALATRDPKDKSPDALTWPTRGGIPVKPLHTAQDTANLHHLGGSPASPPAVATTATTRASSVMSARQPAEQAWTLIEEVEALGGMTRAVASGMPKLRIEKSAARRRALNYLQQCGVKAIFKPGTNIPKAAAEILTLIRSLVVSARTST